MTHRHRPLVEIDELADEEVPGRAGRLCIIRIRLMGRRMLLLNLALRHLVEYGIVKVDRVGRV